MTSTIRKFLLFFLFLTSLLVVILITVSNTYGTFTYAIWTRLEPEPKEVGGAIGVSITEVSYDVNVNDIGDTSKDSGKNDVSTKGLLVDAKKQTTTVDVKVVEKRYRRLLGCRKLPDILIIGFENVGLLR